MGLRIVEARQHPPQGVIAENPMMKHRCRHVKQRQDDEEVGKDFMHFLQILRERSVGSPWRRDFEESKDWQRVTSRDLHRDAKSGHSHPQSIKYKMHDPGRGVGPFDQPLAELSWSGLQAPKQRSQERPLPNGASWQPDRNHRSSGGSSSLDPLVAKIG